MATFRRILVAFDGSDISAQALDTALQLARDCDSKVRVLHAIDELTFVHGFEYAADLLQAARAEGQKMLATTEAQAARLSVTCDTLLVDAPGQRLGNTVATAAAEWKADLVVVGTHGRRGLDRFVMGSGADQILRLAPCPVLVIRGDGTP